MKHTKGPWEMQIRKEDKQPGLHKGYWETVSVKMDGHELRIAAKETLTHVWDGQRYVEHDTSRETTSNYLLQARANASLIAAAPDLLDCLEAIMHEYQKDAYGIPVERFPAWQRALAVIKRARGE